MQVGCSILRPGTSIQEKALHETLAGFRVSYAIGRLDTNDLSGRRGLSSKHASPEYPE